MNIDPLILKQVDEYDHPLIFASLSGAHLYGFPSPDSDFDIRGTHVLPLSNIVGMNIGPETIDRTDIIGGLEIDVVTHDFGMFCHLLLKKNGNILEQIYSPHVLQTSAEHDELRTIAKSCITRHHVHHYAGFADSQWRQISKQPQVKPKTLLYLYRVLLTGIHMMKTGHVEANLLVLNENAKLPYINELVEQKIAGPEKGTIEAANMEFHASEYARLSNALKQASADSQLPEHPTGSAAINDLLVRVRLTRASPNAVKGFLSGKTLR
ncbi:MAG: nucleotidyltransferase domain-containing protein [Fuerstiella sp.]